MVVEPGCGNPPDEVRVEPGEKRDGVAYVRHVLKYNEAAKLGTPGTAHCVAAVPRRSRRPRGTRPAADVHAVERGKTRRDSADGIGHPAAAEECSPKRSHIAPCYYTPMFAPKVAEAYAENAWQSGVTWIYGKTHNDVVPILQPRGSHVYDKSGEPYQACRESRRSFLEGPPGVARRGLRWQAAEQPFLPHLALIADGDKDAERLLGG